MSYNLLADAYANQEDIQTTTYHYCSPEHLARPYRQPLLLEEMRAHDADVLCLQEVDLGFYDKVLHPTLQESGYSGCFSVKLGSPEGCATFYRQSSFSAEWSETIKFREAVNDPRFADLFGPYLADPSTAKALHKITTVAQLTRLSYHANTDGAAVQTNASTNTHAAANEDAGSTTATAAGCRQLLVVNTHLFYHPAAPHIRLIHMAVLVRLVEHLQAKHSGLKVPCTCFALDCAVRFSVHSVFFLFECILRECGFLRASGDFPMRRSHYMPSTTYTHLQVVICGDFNSTPETGLIEYLCTGGVSQAHREWQHGAKFFWSEKRDGKAQPAQPAQGARMTQVAVAPEPVTSTGQRRGNLPALWAAKLTTSQSGQEKQDTAAASATKPGATEGDAGGTQAFQGPVLQHSLKLRPCLSVDIMTAASSTYTGEFCGWLDYIFAGQGTGQTFTTLASVFVYLWFFFRVMLFSPTLCRPCTACFPARGLRVVIGFVKKKEEQYLLCLLLDGAHAVVLALQPCCGCVLSSCRNTAGT